MESHCRASHWNTPIKHRSNVTSSETRFKAAKSSRGEREEEVARSCRGKSGKRGKSGESVKSGKSIKTVLEGINLAKVASTTPVSKRVRM